MQITINPQKLRNMFSTAFDAYANFIEIAERERYDFEISNPPQIDVSIDMSGIKAIDMRKLWLIKILRAWHCIGLKEAKEFVWEWEHALDDIVKLPNVWSDGTLAISHDGTVVELMFFTYTELEMFQRIVNKLSGGKIIVIVDKVERS